MLNSQSTVVNIYQKSTDFLRYTDYIKFRKGFRCFVRKLSPL